MTLKQAALCITILTSSIILPGANPIFQEAQQPKEQLYQIFEQLRQQPDHQNKIEEKINDEKTKLKVDGALIASGLALWFLATRNETLTRTELFSRFTGEILAGVGTLLGVKSLQKLFVLETKLEQEKQAKQNEEAETL